MDDLEKSLTLVDSKLVLPRKMRNSSGTIFALCRFALLLVTKSETVNAIFSDRDLMLFWYSRKSTTYFIRTVMFWETFSWLRILI